MKMIESKTLDSTTASFFYEIGFAFNIADSLGFAALVDQCQLDRMHTCIHTQAQFHSWSCSTLWSTCYAY